MNKIPVSVIILTKNEELNIKKCLKSVYEFSQIIVVDSNSEDDTKNIATKFGANIVNFTWNGGYPKKKQWCLDNLDIKNDWVLYLDADEELTTRFKSRVLNIVNDENSKNGYFAKYDYVFLNKKLKFGYKIHKLILFKRESGHFEAYNDLSVGNMWEVEGHYQPLIEGGVGIIKEPIIHDDKSSLYDYFSRHNRYSDWEAHVSLIYQHKTYESQTMNRKIYKKLFSMLPFRGVIAFLHSYIFKFGFLDGKAGFHFAAARAFYYWQISAKKYELNANSK